MSTLEPADGRDVPATSEPTGKSIGESLLANVDNIALALGIITFFVGSSLGPASSCGTSYVEDTSTAFNILMVVSPLSFAVAAFGALACRRHVIAKGAAFLAYGATAVLVLYILALVSSPCAFY